MKKTYNTPFVALCELQLKDIIAASITSYSFDDIINEREGWEKL